MIGRFSVNHGRVGLIACRTIDNMNLFIKRCGDTQKAGSGIVIPIVDSDLIELMVAVKDGNEQSVNEFLQERYRAIITS
jgi:hypothetical protein